LAAVSAVFIFALGLTVLAGWFSHIPALIQFRDTTSSNDAQCTRVIGAVMVSPIRLCTCGVLRTCNEQNESERFDRVVTPVSEP
jgi:hypothetical protein